MAEPRIDREKDFQTTRNTWVRRTRLVNYINEMIEASYAANAAIISATNARVVQIMDHFHIPTQPRSNGTPFARIRKIVGARVQHFITHNARQEVANRQRQWLLANQLLENAQQLHDEHGAEEIQANMEVEQEDQAVQQPDQQPDDQPSAPNPELDNTRRYRTASRSPSPSSSSSGAQTPPGRPTENRDFFIIMYVILMIYLHPK